MNYALVTGSSAGLGYSVALEFSKRGIIPILTGRSLYTLNQAIESIKNISGLTSIAFSKDLTENCGPTALYDFVSSQKIIPRYLIHNLGGGIKGDCKNPPLDILRQSFRLNLEVAIELNTLFYEDLKTHSSKIVHVGSTSSLHYDAPPSYLISKTAIIPYVKNAARSFAKDGLTIFAVLPGMLSHAGSYIDRLAIDNPERYAQFLQKMTYKKFIPSEDVANYIVSLCLIESTMINGAIIKIDGGVD